MLVALKDDFTGRNLTWQLNLNSATKPELYVDYEKIIKARTAKQAQLRFNRHKHKTTDFDHWFAGGTESLGSLLEESTPEFQKYCKDAKENGLDYAMQLVVGRSEVRLKPPQFNNHCFISYKQVGGSEIALTLYFELKKMGYEPWYDQSTQEINPKAIVDGVRAAAVYILVLSKNVFKSDAVLMEAREAKNLKKPIIVVYENDARRPGHCSFDVYLNTIPEDLKEIFDEEEAIPHQRRFYLLRATMQEIDRRMKRRIQGMES